MEKSLARALCCKAASGMTKSRTLQGQPDLSGKRAGDARAPEAPQLRRCERCGGENAGWRRFCTGCDYDLDPPKVAEAPMLSLPRPRPRPVALPSPQSVLPAAGTMVTLRDANAPPPPLSDYAIARERARASAERWREQAAERRARKGSIFRTLGSALGAAPAWAMNNRVAGLGFVLGAAVMLGLTQFVAWRPPESRPPPIPSATATITAPSRPVSSLELPATAAPATVSEAQPRPSPTPAAAPGASSGASMRRVRAHHLRRPLPRAIHTASRGWAGRHHPWAYAPTPKPRYLLKLGPLKLVRLHQDPPAASRDDWTPRHRKLRHGCSAAHPCAATHERSLSHAPY